MRDERRNYVVVGLFVSVMLAALIVWLAALSGRTGPTDAYEIAWQRVTGLNEGAEVFFDGYPVGVVRGIRPVNPDGSGGFLVRVAVRRGWRIPDDTRASISASSFLAAPSVTLAGGGSARALDPGARIPSQEPASVFTALGEIAEEFGALSRESLKPLMKSLAEGVPPVLADLQTFGDAALTEQNAARISQTLRNLDAAMSDFSMLSTELRRTRTRTDELLVAVEAVLDENRGDLRQALSDLRQAAGDLRYSLAAAAERADEVGDNVESTTRNLDEFSDQLRNDPSVLIRGRESASDPAVVSQ